MLKHVLLIVLFVASCAFAQVQPPPAPQAGAATASTPSAPIPARAGPGAVTARASGAGYAGWDPKLPHCKVGRRPMWNPKTRRHECIREKKAKP